MSGVLISVGEARKRILEATPRLGDEQVPLLEALDRVLAGELRAGADVPPFACSAMDGYAIAAGAGGRLLDVRGESRAGTPAPDPLGDHQAIRISTGAAIPAGATAVIRQEDAELLGDRIRTRVDSAARANIREAGEDMLSGTVVLEPGTRIGAAQLGAAVAAGTGTLTVVVRPDVRILCSGDELREPGKPLRPGQIHNSNGAMLAALSHRCGADVRAPILVRDDLDATVAALEVALAEADVVVVSGGVSVGPHDHVKPALQNLGVEERFWGVALQPGKPTWFGTLGEKLVFGLPGNPVSAVVTFALFTRLALSALQRTIDEHAPQRAGRLAVAVSRNPRREQAIRVRLEHDRGQIVAIPNGPQGSHIVSSLLNADALALIPAGTGELAAGAAVTLEPLPN